MRRSCLGFTRAGNAGICYDLDMENGVKYDTAASRALADEASAYITCKSGNFLHGRGCDCKRHGVPLLNDVNFALRSAVDKVEQLRGLLRIARGE